MMFVATTRHVHKDVNLMEQSEMPFLRLTLHSQPSEEVSGALARELTVLMKDVLNKKVDLTSVSVESKSDIWTIGGLPQEVACYLEVYITAGTNDESQKERFIHEAMRVLKERLGPIHLASYVVISEIPATDWGYDGRTQASRR